MGVHRIRRVSKGITRLNTKSFAIRLKVPLDCDNDGTISGNNNLIGNGTDSGLTNQNGNIVGTTANPIDPGFAKIPAIIDASNTGLNYNPAGVIRKLPESRYRTDRRRLSIGGRSGTF